MVILFSKVFDPFSLSRYETCAIKIFRAFWCNLQTPKLWFWLRPWSSEEMEKKKWSSELKNHLSAYIVFNYLYIYNLGKIINIDYNAMKCYTELIFFLFSFLFSYVFCGCFGVPYKAHVSYRLKFLIYTDWFTWILLF